MSMSWTGYGDVVTELANKGFDQVNSSISMTLAANVEGSPAMGGATNGTGNTLGNLLVGNHLNNKLDGGAGNDELAGNGGDDTLVGGAGNDVLFGGIGNDLLQGNDGNDALVGNDGSDTLIGDAGNDALSGGGGDDVLQGGAGNDDISGGDGNDIMQGGVGNDTYEIDSAADKVTEAAGQGTDEDPVHHLVRSFGRRGQYRESELVRRRRPGRHRQCAQQRHFRQ